MRHLSKLLIAVLVLVFTSCETRQPAHIEEVTETANPVTETTNQANENIGGADPSVVLDDWSRGTQAVKEYFRDIKRKDNDFYFDLIFKEKGKIDFISADVFHDEIHLPSFIECCRASAVVGAIYYNSYHNKTEVAADDQELRTNMYYGITDVTNKGKDFYHDLFKDAFYVKFGDSAEIKFSNFYQFELDDYNRFINDPNYQRVREEKLRAKSVRQK